MMEKIRSLDQVKNIATQAKLDANDLVGQPQCVYFSGELNDAGMRLVEVEPDILQYVEEGNSLVIRGEKSEAAVICIKDKTFDLKEAETSNTLLLLDSCTCAGEFKEDGSELHHRQVQGVAHSYLELRPLRPRLQKLRHLLEENPYTGDLYEDSPQHRGKKYTMEDLLQKVQASQVEIENELAKLKACFVQGHWRMLDFDFESDTIAQILALVEENSWTVDELPLKETLETLENLKPRFVLEHCLNVYGEKKVTSTDEGDVVSYSLDEDAICKMFAELLLMHTDKFDLLEFLKAWQESVPEGMVTSLDQLKGLALIDRSSKPEVIWLFKVSSLPENERDRFDKLFKTKEKWSMEEISPYLEDLGEDQLKIGALLQKHARTSTGANGIRLYNSKRPIK